MIHWNIWTDADGRRHQEQRPSWQEAFRFMDDMVSVAPDANGNRPRVICYQRLPEGVAPTA